MAQPTNTFDGYDSIGNREDLLDTIYSISPTETPIMSNIGTSKATNTYHEWQTDSLASATAANAAIEGDEASGSSISATTRVGNYTQISDKVVVISGTLESVNKAGRNSEMAYQMAKASKELKRDMESAISQNNASVAGNASTARKSAGFESWITTNDVRGTAGSPADGGFSSGVVAAPTDGTQRAYTETILKSAVKKAWEAGGDPSMCVVGPFNKQVMSGFSGIAANRFQVSSPEPGAIIGAADVYVSDFGELQIVPSRFSRDRSALVIDPEMMAVSYLRPFETNDLARTGDSEKKQLLVEYTLEMRNEAAHAVVADLTTS